MKKGSRNASFSYPLLGGAGVGENAQQTIREFMHESKMS